MSQAKVICFDGPDGVGKSTQLAMAHKDLEALGFKVHVTRTPGGTPMGEELRKVFLSQTERHPETDLYIVVSINIALGYEIEKLRKEVDYILIDRGPLSFVAYQVFGGGIPEKEGIEAAQKIVKLWRPDSLLFFTAPVEITQERLRKGTKKLDYFESKGPEFHQRVLDGYNEAVKLFDVTIVDSKPDAETIHQNVMKLLLAA